MKLCLKIRTFFLKALGKKIGREIVGGMVLLSLSGFFVKVMGAFNWVFLSRIIGGEGMGLYQMAYPFYLIALTLSCSGTPTAIALIVAECLNEKKYSKVREIFRVSLLMFLAIGVFFSVSIFLLAGLFVKYHLLRDPRAYYSIIALAPAVPFVTLLACFRGYFQGCSFMLPLAMTDIVEQGVRIVTMLCFARLFMSQGIGYAAGGASLGAAFGGMAGLAVMLYFYRKKQQKRQGNIVQEERETEHLCTSDILRQIWHSALPFIFVNLLIPLVAIMDSLLIPNRLAVAGYSIKEGTILFGYYTGVALPLITASTIFSTALITRLMPLIVSYRVLKNNSKIREQTRWSCFLALGIAFPIYMGLYFGGELIARIIYNAQEAGKIIQIMSIGVLALSVYQVTAGVLQGLRQVRLLCQSILLSAFCKILCNYVLVGNPSYGICGAAWGTNVDYTIGAILNLYYIYRTTRSNMWFIKGQK